MDWTQESCHKYVNYYDHLEECRPDMVAKKFYE